MASHCRTVALRCQEVVNSKDTMVHRGQKSLLLGIVNNVLTEGAEGGRTGWRPRGYCMKTLKLRI